MHDKNQLDFLLGFYRDDPRGLANEIAKGLQRGDFISFRERFRARIVLWRARRAVAAKYPLTPDERQARASEHAAVAAYLAVGVSIVALLVSVFPYVKSP